MSSGRILPGNRVLQYDMQERVVHWISAFAFYVLLTGLAFYSPSGSLQDIDRFSRPTARILGLKSIHPAEK
jgi:cytochrome b subunit of formate dehydrogenase